MGGLMNIGVSKGELAIILSKLKGFSDPNIKSEQYEVDPEIAASVLWQALYSEKVRVRRVADLGCGTGILGVGALIVGAKKVYFVDNDEKSLKIAKNNLDLCIKSENSINGLIKGEFEFIHKDISDFNEKVDTVIMNPPFGTKIRHSDRIFLGKAMEIAQTVYSFHKSESKGFVEAFARDNGFKMIGQMDFAWPLKQTMKFHTRKIHRIPVSCFVFERV
jgi:putative methylase